MSGWERWYRGVFFSRLTGGGAQICGKRPGCRLTDTLSARLLEYQATIPAIAEVRLCLCVAN